MKKEIYVFGHKNPDTDSVCSAIAYARLKQLQNYENVLPYVLGEINRETRFVLDYFNVEQPEILTDIKITLKDMDLYKPTLLKRSEPVKKAWDLLSSGQKSKSLPVVDNNGLLEGLVSIGNITKLYMEAADENYLLNFEILFKNLIEILDVTAMYGNYCCEKIEGKIYIDEHIDEEKNLTNKDIFITSNPDRAKNVLKKENCGCVIITNGLNIEKFKDYGSCVVSVNDTLFKTISLINQAVSVGSIMQSDSIVSFSIDAEVDDTIAIVQGSPYRNFPVIDRDGKFFGLVSRRHLIEYDKKKVILVDHNERSQSVEGLEQADIVEIIDHHRVADVKTSEPLFIRAEPVGSTATIVYKMYMEKTRPISKNIAGLLLSAILSDTLMFSSPTSTEDDKQAAEYLSQIAEVNIEDYGREMFSVSTSLEGFSPEEILSVDRKQFIFGKYSTYISQVNTLDFRSIVNMQNELIKAMEEYVERKKCDLMLLMITDIVEGGSEFLAVGRAKDLVYRAFSIDADSAFLKGVVSRKKQVVPRLTISAQR